MEFFNVRFVTPDFHTYFGWATIRKWTKGAMILKVGERHMNVCKQEWRGWRGVVSMQTFTHKFLNVVPSP